MIIRNIITIISIMIITIIIIIIFIIIIILVIAIILIVILILILITETSNVHVYGARFGAISESIAACQANCEARYVMSCKLARMLEAGMWTSARAAAMDDRLLPLRVNRQKLADVHNMLHLTGVLPPDAPPSFRTGRNAQLQLSREQHEELLAFVQYHSKFGLALSVVQIKRAYSMVWRIQAKQKHAWTSSCSITTWMEPGAAFVTGSNPTSPRKIACR